MGKISDPDLTGGFKAVNSLTDGPRHPKQQGDGRQTKPNESHLKSFIEKPRPRILMSQGQKRGSDDSGMGDELPPRKKQASHVDPDFFEEEMDTEVSNAKRTRKPAQTRHNRPNHDPFHSSKAKEKMETIEDSDSDTSSHTDPGITAGRASGTPKIADIKRTAFTTTKTDTSLKILRASSLNSTYDHNDEKEDKQIYLGIKDHSLKPINNQGSTVANYDWLEVKPATMQKIEYSRDFAPVSIYRSGGVNLPPLLHLEFASSGDHSRFIEWINDRVLKLEKVVTIQPIVKSREFLKRSFERSFATSHDRIENNQLPELISPQQPMGGPPAVSAVSPVEREKTRRKMAQSMKGNLPASHTTSTAVPVDEKHMVSVVTRSSRRRTVASSGKPAESSAADFISLEDDGPNSIVPKKNSRRPSATRTPPSARWIDLHPDWVKAWDDKPLIYPSSGRDAAQITKDDIPRLEDNELLNDSLIIFSSRYLLEQQAKEMSSLLGRIYIFNPWFYKKLSLSSKRGIDYEAVKSWTSKVDLFAHDFIIVPVNENFHWYLAIICYPGKLLPQKKDDDDVMMIDDPQDVSTEPQQAAASTSPGQTEAKDDSDIIMIESDVMPKSSSRPAQAAAPKDQKTAKATVDPKDPRVITFDSLGGAHSPTCTSLREYLVLEAKHRHGVDIKIPTRFGLTAKGIPEQNDFNSCGAYLLGYLQQFFKNPDGSVERIVLKQGPGWEIDPKEVRANMRTAIMDARNKQNDQAKKEKEAKDARKRIKAARLANGTPPALSSPISELPPSEGMSPAPTRSRGWFKTKTRKETSQELALAPPKSPQKNNLLESRPRSPHQVPQGHTPKSSQTPPPKPPQLHAQEPSKEAPLSLHQVPLQKLSTDQPSVTSPMSHQKLGRTFLNRFRKLGLPATSSSTAP